MEESARKMRTELLWTSVRQLSKDQQAALNLSPPLLLSMQVKAWDVLADPFDHTLLPRQKQKFPGLNLPTQQLLPGVRCAEKRGEGGVRGMT